MLDDCGSDVKKGFDTGFVDIDRVPAFIINDKAEFVVANDFFCSKFGVSKKDVAGLSFNKAAFLPESTRMRADEISKFVGKSVSNIHLRFLDKNRDETSFEAETCPYFVDGKLIGNLFVLRNISEDNVSKKRYVNEKKLLHTDFLETIEKINDKRDEINFILRELEKKYADLRLQKEKISQIHEEWRRGQAELDEKKYEIKKLRNELSRAEKKMELQKNELNYLRNNLKECESKRHMLEKAVSPLRFDLERKKRDLELKNQRIDEKQEEIKNLKTELKNRHEEIRSKNEKIERFEEKYQEMLRKLEDSLEKIKVKNQELKNKQQEIENLNEKIKDIMETNETIKTELSFRNNLIDSLKEQITQNQMILFKKSSILSEINQTLKLKEKLVEQGKEDMLKQQKTINEIQTELKRKEEDIETLKNDLENRNKLIDILKNQLNERETQFLFKAGTINQLRLDLDKKQKIIEKHRMVINEKENEIKKLQTNLQKRIHEVENIKKQLFEGEEKEKKLLEEIKNIRGLLEEKNCLINELREKMEYKKFEEEIDKISGTEKNVTWHDEFNIAEKNTDDLIPKNHDTWGSALDTTKTLSSVDHTINETKHDKTDMTQTDEELGLIHHIIDEKTFHISTMQETEPFIKKPTTNETRDIDQETTQRGLLDSCREILQSKNTEKNLPSEEKDKTNINKEVEFIDVSDEDT